MTEIAVSFARRLTVAQWVAWGGIFIAAFGAWLMVPPVSARSVAIPVVFGVLGVAAGIWGLTRGARRLGWGAVTIGVIGIGLGYLATQSSETKLDDVFTWSALLTATLRFATPLTFAALGGMFSERAGVVNIGLEGMMLAGAFFGILGADKLGHWTLGILTGVLAGGVLGLIHAILSVHLRADQIVGGTAINFLALGVTGYFFIQVYGDQGTPGSGISRIPNVHIAFLDDVSFLQVFSNLNLMIWLALAMLPLTYVVLFKTSLGLRLRSVGEHPRAADTVGISVYKTRYVAVIVSGMLASLGGVFLSVGYLSSFSENMTAGRGFIGLAALIFGNWRPFGAFAAALLFGFSTALAFQLDTYSESAEVLFQALPYVLTLIAVAGVVGRSVPPAAVGRPYVKQ
jgi:simple sugar transport system permease protein